MTTPKKPRTSTRKSPASKPPRPTSKLLAPPPPATLPGGSLTAQRAKYIEARGMGMVPMQAAGYAGYKDPSSYAYALEKDPTVIEALAKVQEQNAKLSRTTRKKVMDLIDEALDMARAIQDPMAMLRGVQELNRMCGYYAPEKKELELKGPRDAMRKELALMSEADLVEMAGGFKGVLEGEFEVVTDDRDGS